MQQLQFPNGRKVYFQNRSPLPVSGVGLHGLRGLRGLDGLEGVLPQNIMPLVGLGVIKLPQVHALVGLGVLPAAAIPIAKKVGDKIVSAVTSQYHQDNQLIEYRDRVLKLLATIYDFNQEPFYSTWPPFKLDHASIPDRKFGKDYAEEFARLHDFVRTLLNKTRAGWGDAFYNKSWEIAAKYLAADSARSYKGAPNEALEWALANPMATGQATQQPVTQTSNILQQLIPNGVQLPNVQLPPGILSQGQQSQLPTMTANAGGGNNLPEPPKEAGFTTENLMIMGGIAIGTGVLVYVASQMNKPKKAA